MMHLRLTYRVYPQSEKETKTLASPPSYSLIKYTNSNYADNSEDRKLVIKHYLFHPQSLSIMM